MDKHAPRVALMATQEVAAYLGCSVRMVRKMVFERRVPYVKVGRLVRFRRSDINQYVTANTHFPAAVNGNDQATEVGK